MLDQPQGRVVHLGLLLVDSKILENFFLRNIVDALLFILLFQGFQSVDYLPFFDLYSKSSIPTEHKDILKKFSSFHECGNAPCRAAGSKEHYHCISCYKVCTLLEISNISFLAYSSRYSGGTDSGGCCSSRQPNRID